MVEIHGLAFRFGAILVDQHDICGKTAEKQSIGEGRSDIACPHDCDTCGRRGLRRRFGHEMVFEKSGRLHRSLAVVHAPVSFPAIAELKKAVLGVVPLSAIRTHQEAAP